MIKIILLIFKLILFIGSMAGIALNLYWIKNYLLLYTQLSGILWIVLILFTHYIEEIKDFLKKVMKK